MNIQTHLINNTKVAEVISDEMIIRTAEDGLGLLGDIYYQGFDNLIIYDRNITVDFLT